MTSPINEQGTSASGANPPPGKKGVILPRGGACAICRRRKLRCDGARPTCSPCIQFNRECNYAGSIRPSGPQSATLLNAKLASLRERFEELKSRQAPGVFRDLAASEERTIETTETTDAGVPSCGTTIHPPESVEVSEQDKKFLFEQVFKNTHCCSYFPSPERFMTAISDPDPARRPHPCLVYAMLLVGMAFIPTPGANNNERPPSASGYTPTSLPSPEDILARARAELDESLAQVDRLEDYFSATGLLCYWYIRNTRLQEAQYLSGATARLIVGCRLHQINADLMTDVVENGLDGDFSAWDYTLLGRPKDAYELGNRINIFWQSFFHDKILSMITGLPSSYEDSADSQITTVWPRPLDEYESGVALQNGCFTSINDLLLIGDTNLHETPCSTTTPGSESVFALMTQAITFVERTTRLSTAVQAESQAALDPVQTRSKIDRLQNALNRFVARIPSSPEDARLHAYKPLGHLAEPVAASSNSGHILLAYVHLMTHVAQIHIYRALEAVSSPVVSHSALSAVLLRGALQGPSTGAAALPTYHDLRVEVARKAVDVARMAASQIQAEEGTVRLFDEGNALGIAVETKWLDNPMFGFLLTSVSIVLIEETQNMERQLGATGNNSPTTALIAQSLGTRLDDARRDLTLIRGIIQYLVEIYPVLVFHLNKLDSLRRA